MFRLHDVLVASIDVCRTASRVSCLLFFLFLHALGAILGDSV